MGFLEKEDRKEKRFENNFHLLIPSAVVCTFPTLLSLHSWCDGDEETLVRKSRAYEVVIISLTFL